MIIKLIAASISVLVFNFNNKASAQKKVNVPTENNRPDPRFLDDIEFTATPVPDEPLQKNTVSPFAGFQSIFRNRVDPLKTSFNGSIEDASSLQLKYSLLLDTEVEAVQNLNLFNAIDNWYGTPYLWGGSTKRGIDCSAFVQAIYSGNFGLMLPRTAREQYKLSQEISRTELKQGDLVFFNTLGGVSHVGIYLQNNKFVHAASSGGVMISDLYDAYWVKRFIAAGRIDAAAATAVVTLP